MAIPTPAQAQEIDDLSFTQFNTIKTFFGVNDYPYQPDKTYIVFDADAGNNNFHIDIGSTKTYTILKGDGTIKVSYTDTGGVKILNYAVAGRYLIVIDGDFNGINVGGNFTSVPQSDRDKYIELFGGTNYPTTIAGYALHYCQYLINANFQYAISFEATGHAFENCTLLITVNFLSVTNIADYTFKQCASLITVNFPNVASIGSTAFKQCVSLITANFRIATSIGDYAFHWCASLITANFPNVASIGEGGFYICASLITANFPNGTSIGENAFHWCASLITANFPNIASIGFQAFYSCTSLSFFMMDYNDSLSISPDVFISVKLSDLYVRKTSSAGALSIQTQFTNSRCRYLNGFRLLY